ncbi:MAG: phosphoribosylglycinamide formyltransferase [Microbacteriaceae bacterium]|nr:phosphoribosylglycinamide formyltransferase [Microbacteriaceae bacterium]
MIDVLVLISGTGSNLRALLDAAAQADFPARIVAVGSDTDAPGFAHAREFGIPTFVVSPPAFDSRESWGDELRSLVALWNPDLVVCAGFMRILPANFVRAFAPHIINVHPALLPLFPGAHAVRDALAAGVHETGSTVHVVDEGVDTGPIIDQVRVAVDARDTEESLHEKIKQIERPLLVDTVVSIAHGHIDLKELVAQ